MSRASYSEFRGSSVGSRSAAPSASSRSASLDALSALPYAVSGRPGDAAAALAYFDTLSRQREEALAKNAALESATAALTRALAQEVAAAESRGASSPFYIVEFGRGAIGMRLATDAGAGDALTAVRVAQLRRSEDGAPLLALACGRIAVGDAVVAVNGRLLARYGPPTPDAVAAEFRLAARPLRVLFRRDAAARLAAAGAGDAGSEEDEGYDDDDDDEFRAREDAGDDGRGDD